VTRTRRQASALTKKLTRLGADVLEIPTIRITPIALEEAARSKLTDFSHHFDWVVFTSPNAVELFFAEYFELKSDLRDLGPVKMAAVGPATSQQLGALHLGVDLQPEVYTTEKLAESFSAKEVASKRFCLPHGNLADPSLANRLRELGGSVEEWTLYQTEPEPADPTGARDRYLRDGAHWITFTSSSTAENWHALRLQIASGAPQPKAVSLGPVTSATLRKLGYQIAAEAPTSTVDALIATISRLSIESRMPTTDELMDDGNTALAIGELAEAANYFRQVVEHDPQFQDGWHALSMALYKLDRYEESIETGKRAARIDPNNQFVWSSLSLAYNANKQKAEAEAAGAKARIISWGGKINPESLDLGSG
jgi:uroporphyrinogen-III synthase